MRGRAWMEIKYTLVFFFVEYGAVTKKTPENNALLKSIYTDLRHSASFASPHTLFRAAKQKNPNILYKDVESWLENQPVYTKYRRIKVKYPCCKVLSRGLRYQYQANLVDYSALKRDNHSFTFLLTIIDIFSRFALAIPIKSK